MYVPQLTADGSFTFFCAEFGEAFHSHYGAHQEAQLKFVEPTQLQKKAQQHGSCFNTKNMGGTEADNALPQSLRLLDVCYGLGYNTAAALATIWAVNPNCYIEVVGLEFTFWLLVFKSYSLFPATIMWQHYLSSLALRGKIT